MNFISGQAIFVLPLFEGWLVNEYSLFSVLTRLHTYGHTHPPILQLTSADTNTYAQYTGESVDSYKENSCILFVKTLRSKLAKLAEPKQLGSSPYTEGRSIVTSRGKGGEGEGWERRVHITWVYLGGKKKLLYY